MSLIFFSLKNILIIIFFFFFIFFFIYTCFILLLLLLLLLFCCYFGICSFPLGLLRLETIYWVTWFAIRICLRQPNATIGYGLVPWSYLVFFLWWFSWVLDIYAWLLAYFLFSNCAKAGCPTLHLFYLLMFIWYTFISIKVYTFLSKKKKLYC